MSSIGSTLNSVNASLLSEIAAFNATQNKTSGAPAPTSPTTPTSSDQVNFSQVSQLFQELRQLQQSNPAEFKQVLTDAATQLQAAASQTTSPQQAAFLNNLAGKFQTAAASGDLSALSPNSGSANNSTNPYAAHGHHHAIPAGIFGSLPTNAGALTGAPATSQIQSLLSGVAGL
jgi:hypothetical protein